MSLASRAGILLLAVLGFVAVREYLLVTTAPTELTGLAVRQLEPDDASAEALRVADSSKNWLLSGWAVLLFAAVVAAALFGDQVRPAGQKKSSAAGEPPLQEDS